MNQVVLRVAEEFGQTPGPRGKGEGEYSGDEFRDTLLIPRFEQARSENAVLFVDLDGTEGYATSFLEAAFGGLARIYGPDDVLPILQLKSDDEPYLVEEIYRYVKEAKAR